ncbi:hypothetical protein FN846DRAFT_6633 [Sphaerosporella brunnea]|uniref:E3 ubiquitin protein ligase n=1 Tax=Sphaerosporella brunnea TaxID=1250544 RepID=A0A5J5FCJ6_9PEZI|nr:hypothetical protein FN846DRAFT_6633 [Sphaerosporella brunnea]
MRSSSVVVMEDRKRSVPHDPSDESHPPYKRQAIQSSSHPTSQNQVPQSQEDVVHFQKEAIWRQMQEYKRERNILESRVEELDKKSAYHDDHLRIVDAWWTQSEYWPVFLTAARARIRMEPRQNSPLRYCLTMLPASPITSEKSGITSRKH